MPLTPQPFRIPHRIAFVVDHSFPYSADEYSIRTHGIALALKNLGHSVVVINRPGHPWDIYGYVEDGRARNTVIDGIQYIFSRSPSAKGLRYQDWLQAAVDRISEICSVFKVGSIFASSDWENARPAMLSARQMAIPFYYEIRELAASRKLALDPSYKGAEAYKYALSMEKELSASAEAVFTLNDAMLDQLVMRGVSREKISLIPVAADPVGQLIDGKKLQDSLEIKATYVVGYVGPFNPFSGIDNLIIACAALWKKGVDIQLLLIGSSDTFGLLKSKVKCQETERFKKIAKEHQFESRLVIVNTVEVKERPNYYALMNLVVIPTLANSLTEVMDLAAPIEALVNGKQVLVSRLQTTNKLLKDISGVNWIDQNDASGLAYQIEGVLRSVGGDKRGFELPFGVACSAASDLIKKIKLESENQAFSIAPSKNESFQPLVGEGNSLSNLETFFNKNIRGTNLNVAVILDEFSRMCWEHEFNLVSVTPANWRDELSRKKIDFLFVESAWRGNDGAWQYLVSNSKRTPGKDLVALVAWCRENKIPTVFWNKEDPTDFEHFLNTAKLFDIVFTTDENCVAKYKSALAHNNVFSLAFGAQPMIHNPVPLPVGRNGKTAFAGGWYSDRHDQRRIGAEIVLKPAFKYGLDIFDRNYGKPELQDKHAWPKEYQDHIVGGLPYQEMLEGYRKYSVFLNVNSVTDSPTMFSRRVFELLACGTPVISSYALGIEKMLGNNVFLSRSAEETTSHLERLLKDKNFRLRAIEAGLKAVMSEHTYAHRLMTIVETINKVFKRTLPLTPDIIKRNDDIEIPPFTPAVALPPPPKLEFPDPVGRISRPELVVGTIIDEIFEPYWMYECRLVKFNRENWKEVLTKDRPAFLFIDSAWHGNGGAWSGHINRQGVDGPSPDFEKLVSWCKGEKIPVVFWSREDPPNFEIFKHTAVLCDYIYTTDSDCIDRYKKIVGHDRVGVLPFAAQPRIHNPVNVQGGRVYDLTFAGTWYATKHPDRKVQMETILEPALEHNVHIYDRMLFYTQSNAYVYPQIYRKHIVGTLNYEEMLAVMRQYRVMLNVNSVIASPTMCSCRVIEALMCGSAVVSGYAKGIENLIGEDLVPLPRNKKDTASNIRKFLDDELYREQTVKRAQRKIFREHTCSIRMEKVLSDIGLTSHKLGNESSKVSVVAPTYRHENLKYIIENYKRQTYQNKELVVILHGLEQHKKEFVEIAEKEGLENYTVLTADKSLTLGECLNLGIARTTGDVIAKFDDDDYYGPHYIADQMDVFQYVDADVVGKHSYYVYMVDSDETYIRLAGRENSYQKFVSGATLMIKKRVFEKVPFGVLTIGEDSDFLERCAKNGIKIYSTDRFNFCCRRKNDEKNHTWKIADTKYREKLTQIGLGFDLSKIDA